jgi:hypothetical protein
MGRFDELRKAQVGAVAHRHVTWPHSDGATIRPCGVS